MAEVSKWIEITVDELTTLLAKTRIGIEQQEEWKLGPTAMLSRPGDLAEMIASHARGLRQADDEVAGAHICCDHVRTSRASYELGQADHIVHMLGNLPERHVKRVLRWVWDYLTDGDEPPF